MLLIADLNSNANGSFPELIATSNEARTIDAFSCVRASSFVLSGATAFPALTRPSSDGWAVLAVLVMSGFLWISHRPGRYTGE